MVIPFPNSSTVCYFVLSGSWKLKVTLTLEVHSELLYNVGLERLPLRLDCENFPAELILLAIGIVDGNLAFTSNQERSSCSRCRCCCPDAVFLRPLELDYLIEVILYLKWLAKSLYNKQSYWLWIATWPLMYNKDKKSQNTPIWNGTKNTEM